MPRSLANQWRTRQTLRTRVLRSEIVMEPNTEIVDAMDGVDTMHTKDLAR